LPGRRRIVQLSVYYFNRFVFLHPLE
jgi:hypothetical protein